MMSAGYELEMSRFRKQSDIMDWSMDSEGKKLAGRVGEGRKWEQANEGVPDCVGWGISACHCDKQ